jgi:(R,R)-butanediol dehydrogenase/meso-butanediol dehydrogenase/diacetyl reductase
MTPTVRSVVIAPDRSLRVERVSARPLGPGDVRLRVAFCGICGSDLHNISMPDTAPAGTVLGHELTGRVIERGSDVTRLAVGDRVAVLPFEYCGACEPCTRGLDHLCAIRAATKIGGAERAGGYAETVVVPASTAYRLPAGMRDEHAALVEPLAVAVHGVAVSEADASTPAAILGAGPIGVMTAVALRLAGFSRIVAVEPNAQRRRRLEALGTPTVGTDAAAQAVSETLGERPRVLFDCTGHPSGPSLGLELLAARGRLVMLGYTEDPAPFDLIALLTKEIVVRGAVGYRHAEFRRALEHIASGDVPCDEIVTGVRSLEQAQQSFDELLSGTAEHTKLLLQP